MSIRPFMSHWDILCLRPMEHALALIILYTAGLRFIAGSPLMIALSPAVATLWGLLGFFAGALIIAGMHYSKRDPVVGRAIEMWGWVTSLALLFGGPVLVVLGWTSIPPGGSPGLVDDVVIGVGALIRTLFLRREAKSERKVIEALRDRRELG